MTRLTRTPRSAAIVAAITAAVLLAATPVPAQQDGDSVTVDIMSRYRVAPNITYLVADGYESKLDVMAPRGETAVPTLIYIHGGGWVGGTKESNVLRTLPYLEMGWAVVNVEYRLGRNALAPGAVEDCRCALRWVYENAEDYNIDTNRIVVTGASAGGHLSLTTGMLPASAGLDRLCPGRDASRPGWAAADEYEMPVAAIVNWFGITDVGDLLDGVNAKSYAVAWMGSRSDRMELAKRVSPMTYVRGGLPPILTIHGDVDNIVPYQHALDLHAKLDEAGVANKIHTVPGKGHGNFSPDEQQEIFRVIRAFLNQHVTAGGAASTGAE
ncbi:MAG: alpha/beta hydrolase [Acidobacteria bacterium]|nr:alpha/beta hydrolase [Acidobacteriota bacterium]